MSEVEIQTMTQKEKAFKTFLEEKWNSKLDSLLPQQGQNYFDLLAKRLSELFGADRVYVASFDLELKFGTSIADYHDEQSHANTEFKLAETFCHELAMGSALLIGDELTDLYKNDATIKDYRALVALPSFDEACNVIGMVAILFKREFPFVFAAKKILDLSMSRIGAEMMVFYKTRLLNDMNHQLLRELAISNQLKEELSRVAYLDRVTGLPNREQFFLDVKISKETPNHWVAMFGLDCFKFINEHMGMDAGDMLMKAIGQRFAESRELNPRLENSRLYKWTGDEFLIFGAANEPGDEKAVMQLCNEMFKQAFDVRGTQVHVSRSTGVTLLKDHKLIDEAVVAVSNALRRAKLRGGNGIVYYKKDMKKAEVQFFKIHSMMQEGMAKRQFVPYYQPIYDPHLELYSGYEALMRWIGSDGKPLFFPDHFIPIAERSGLIIALGKEMIATAIKNITEWNRHFNVERDLAINLSPLQFYDEQLIGDIDKILTQHNADPGLIKFEITESLFVQESDLVLGKLHDLKQMGFKLSLDDFGTGYSSLAYLQKYPFDIIKIDKCFVDGVLHSAKSKALIRAVQLLATDIGMKIVAEGVESEDQAACLAMMGIDYLQGYFFSKPLPAHEIEATYMGIFNADYNDQSLKLNPNANG